jgi:hypothetical protein
MNTAFDLPLHNSLADTRGIAGLISNRDRGTAPVKICVGHRIKHDSG